MKIRKQLLQPLRKCFNIFTTLTIGFIMIKVFIISILKVPSNSMQPNIEPGDWIIVNKFGYGQTAKLFGFTFKMSPFISINRGDVIVFHFPEGDTVLIDAPTQNYYDLKKRLSNNSYELEYDMSEKLFLPLINRIAYVKRCVGLPGETIEIKNRNIFINNKKYNDSVNCLRLYYSYCDKSGFDRIVSSKYYVYKEKDGKYILSLNPNDESIVFDLLKLDSLKLKPHHYSSYMFPRKLHGILKWDTVNYGPLLIPQKGEKIHLTVENIPIYKRLIEEYENNQFEIKDEKIMINGEETKVYIPKQDYYFMMGDNREITVDSRNWGFVPADHIIGKVFGVGFNDNINGIINKLKSLKVI